LTFCLSIFFINFGKSSVEKYPLPLPYKATWNWLQFGFDLKKEKATTMNELDKSSKLRTRVNCIIKGTTAVATTASRVNISKLRDFVLANFPRDSPLRAVFQCESEELDPVDFGFKLKLWLKLTREKL
jgi:hypothetical protein